MNAWNVNADEACLTLNVNGKTEKVSKGTIANLGAFIQSTAAKAGFGKIAVYIDGDEVDADEIHNYGVDDIKEIKIKPFDIVRL